MEQSENTKRLRLYAAGIVAESERYDARLSAGRIESDPERAGAMQALAWIVATLEAAASTVDVMVLDLHETHGVTVRSLSEHMGTSVGTTHRRLARARDLAPEGGWAESTPEGRRLAAQRDREEHGS